jgi:hypothetical protein
LKFLFLGMPVGGAEDLALGVYHYLGPDVSAQFVFLRKLDVLGEEARRAGMPVGLVPVFPEKRISPFGIWRLSRWIVREGIELVHSQNHHAHIHGVLAANFVGRRRSNNGYGVDIITVTNCFGIISKTSTFSKHYQPEKLLF